MSLGSGNFEVASDLKDLFKTGRRPSETSQTSNLKPQTSRTFSETKRRTPQKAMDDFYAEAERNQHRQSESNIRASEESNVKAYYSKRPVDVEVDAFVDDSSELGLHEAASVGDTKAMQRELLLGARLDAEDANGCTALHFAVRNLHAQNITGWTALHEAATTGQEQVIRHLLMLGADVRGKTKEGDTALHKAARWNHLALVQALINAGSDADAVDNLGRRPSDRTSNPERAEEASSSWVPPSRPTSAQVRTQRQSSLADFWETYEARWKLFASASDGSPTVAYNDVPFPGRDAESSLDVMLYGTTDDESKRKRLRKELLRWHPDKFLGTCSSRLRKSDQERIMAQVKEIARMLHTAIKNYS
ncbi:hypothetical protein WJX73_007168 [Symbiochloris irregularis]|uniref:NF-kappa-B inhibitor-like protein 1 n=1 Tax=Symbiochloris irregularis TaxID=706552 RepID=A0AAW1PW70_9CHLO